MVENASNTKDVIGRLAAHPYRVGDPMPAVGSKCLVSGAHCDVDSDQHRSYGWRKVIGYTDDNQFVCLQTHGCWPAVERLTHCWFAEIPTPRSSDETCELRMADGTPLYDYLRNAVPESTPMDDWTRGFEECKRRLFDIVGPQLRPPLKASGEPDDE